VLADAVSRLVLGKFGDLTDNFSSPHARRKVLAGVVMTTGKRVCTMFNLPAEVHCCQSEGPCDSRKLPFIPFVFTAFVIRRCSHFSLWGWGVDQWQTMCLADRKLGLIPSTNPLLKKKKKQPFSP
jgi:hypothetical protein